ncbi:hypothetical protein EMIT0373P_10630 [Pseudomonas chlororaphis]
MGLGTTLEYMNVAIQAHTEQCHWASESSDGSSRPIDHEMRKRTVFPTDNLGMADILIIQIGYLGGDKYQVFPDDGALRKCNCPVIHMSTP